MVLIKADDSGHNKPGRYEHACYKPGRYEHARYKPGRYEHGHYEAERYQHHYEQDSRTAIFAGAATIFTAPIPCIL